MLPSLVSLPKYYKIEIHDHISIFIAPPNITSPIEDMTVRVLEQVEDIVLNCAAMGVPAPTIMWYRGTTQLTGTEVRTTISDGRITSDTDGFYFVNSTLTISPSNRDDSGTYWCETENTILGSPRNDRRMFNITLNCILCMLLVLTALNVMSLLIYFLTLLNSFHHHIRTPCQCLSVSTRSSYAYLSS